MKIHLTPAQQAEISPHLQHGVTLLARIDRETFQGSNAATSGAPFIEFGAVPTSSLPALRIAIREANHPKPSKAKSVKGIPRNVAGASETAAARP